MEFLAKCEAVRGVLQEGLELSKKSSSKVHILVGYMPGEAACAWFDGQRPDGALAVYLVEICHCSTEQHIKATPLVGKVYQEVFRALCEQPQLVY